MIDGWRIIPHGETATTIVKTSQNHGRLTTQRDVKHQQLRILNSLGAHPKIT